MEIPPLKQEATPAPEDIIDTTLLDPPPQTVRYMLSIIVSIAIDRKGIPYVFR